MKRGKRNADMQSVFMGEDRLKEVMNGVACEVGDEKTRERFARCAMENFNRRIADFAAKKHDEEPGRQNLSMEQRRKLIKDLTVCDVSDQCKDLLTNRRYEICQCVNNLIQRSEKIKRLANICLPQGSPIECELEKKFRMKLQMTMFEMSDICESNHMQWYYEARNRYKQLENMHLKPFPMPVELPRKPTPRPEIKKEEFMKVVESLLVEYPEREEKIKAYCENNKKEGQSCDNLAEWLFENAPQLVSEIEDWIMEEPEEEEISDKTTDTPPAPEQNILSKLNPKILEKITKLSNNNNG